MFSQSRKQAAAGGNTDEEAVTVQTGNGCPNINTVNPAHAHNEAVIVS